MQTIAIIGQKGGTGKTTLALSLAVAASRDSKSAFILDLDPQANAANWADRRTTQNPGVATAAPGRLAQEIAKVEALGTDFLIIDTPGKIEGAATAAAKAADLILIPCRPSIHDIETIPATMELLHITAGQMPAIVVLNFVPIAGKRHEEATRAIEKMGLPVAPVWLSQRSAFFDAPTGGQTVTEYDPHGKASFEVEKVYQFTIQVLNHRRSKPNAKSAARLSTV
jgi:chromosome partitioning protein